MALGLSTFLPQTIWIRRTAAVNAIAYILVACAWWPAWTGEHVQGFGTWLANIPGVAGLAAAAAWQPAWALLYLGVGVTLVQLINHTIREAPLFYLLIPDLSAALMFCTVFVAASVVALRTGQTLDATIASTHAAAAGAAAAAAKDVERERFNALIHDTVMSTLLAAARTDSDSTVAEQSRRTLARLDHLRSGVESAERLDPDAVLAQLRSAASEVDENVAFTSHVGSNANTVEFPSEPVSALAAALSEALRNSKKHAGPDARRSVDAIVEETRIEVTVCDNGIGFDPRAVPTHRLGIAVSIHARLRSIPGGAADVASTPGAGTTVTLSWQRAEKAPR
ncbi:sensor histidine kinase [Rhodococcus erythropolis]|uniref:sensor histidine kinase n=1 Tax=Rhodococcus erythropolis TaxID=1833 RepID=UPI0027DB9EDF|nr:ATP-binding protein [Rhodococcus erythropolis]